MKRIALISLFLLGCQSESTPQAIATVTTTTTSTTTTTINKDFFSQWDQDTYPSKRLPLAGKSFNLASGDTILSLDTGLQCICTFTMVGSPQYTISFSSCSGTGCTGIPNTYTWTNSNGHLTLCQYSAPSVCESYH